MRHAEGAGCYGHNGADDAALDAVYLARAVEGQPVRLQWMREDEFGWEPFGPAMVVTLEGAVDAGGTVSFSENEAALVLGGGRVSWSEILVRTSGDRAAVTQSLEQALPPLARVVTGASRSV